MDPVHRRGRQGTLGLVACPTQHRHRRPLLAVDVRGPDTCAVTCPRRRGATPSTSWPQPPPCAPVLPPSPPALSHHLFFRCLHSLPFPGCRIVGVPEPVAFSGGSEQSSPWDSHKGSGLHVTEGPCASLAFCLGLDLELLVEDLWGAGRGPGSALQGPPGLRLAGPEGRCGPRRSHARRGQSTARAGRAGAVATSPGTDGTARGARRGGVGTVPRGARGAL